MESQRSNSGSEEDPEHSPGASLMPLYEQDRIERAGHQGDRVFLQPTCEAAAVYCREGSVGDTVAPDELLDRSKCFHWGWSYK